MIKTEVCKGKSVYGIEKHVSDNQIHLKWKSDGLGEFIVFYSEKKENLLFNGGGADMTAAFFDGAEEKLLSEKSLQLNNGVTCYYVTLAELMRNAGIQIKNSPGYYSVCGAKTENGNVTVYAQDNIFQMTVNVLIEQKNQYKIKGFIKKVQIFTGYRYISMKAYPALTGGKLKYKIGGYKYPFPDEVVKNGGGFYVAAGENEAITFESEIEGIIIQ